MIVVNVPATILYGSLAVYALHYALLVIVEALPALEWWALMRKT